MSAPVVERPRRTGRPSRTAAPVIPAQRGAGVRKAHTQKAYAKKEERLRRLVGGVRPARSGTPRRAQFVLLVMVLLGTGLVLTLWLSTAAAADSYRLQDARAAAGALGERSEQLRREVAVAGSAPEIARRAGEMGMVAVQDPARVVVGADGSVVLVGEPQVAQAPAPPVVAAPPPAEAPDGTPVEDAPVEDAAPVDGVPVDETPVDETTADQSTADETTADQTLADGAEAASDPAASDPAASDPAASDPAASDPAASGTDPATAPN